MGTIVGTGPSAPAVVAGETAEAQPSPTAPTVIPVPTATMPARAEDVQVIALNAIDNLWFLMLRNDTQVYDSGSGTWTKPAYDHPGCRYQPAGDDGTTWEDMKQRLWGPWLE